VYNEESSLPQLIQELNSVMLALDATTEIIFVDDASTDSSYDLIKQLIIGIEGYKLLQLPKRGGQTGCFQAGFSAARGEYIIRMDSDLQDDPRDLPKFYKIIKTENPDLIMGLREHRQHTRLFRLATSLYDVMILILFDSTLFTNSCSLVAFRASHVTNIKLRHNDHRYLPLIVMSRVGVKTKQLIVNHRTRKHGRSRYSTCRKLLLGPPEFILFLLRLSFGRYQTKNPSPLKNKT